MKNLVLFVVYVFLFNYRNCEVKAVETQRCSPKKSSASSSLRLKDHLFCSYDSHERPAERKKSIQVLMQLMPKFMEFDSRTSTFSLHFWLKMSWIDAHLTWNPGEFENLKSLYVSNSDIWIPDLIIVNTGDRFELPVTTCIVTNTGNVTCVIPTKTSVFCASDFTHWPFDEQQCQIRSGSNTYYSHEVDFNFINPPILMDGYIPNHSWLMNRQEAKKIFFNTIQLNYTEIRFEFDLKRHSRMSHSLYITPAAIFIAFTLTVLWLDSKSMERITLAGVNFVGHLYCIYDLHWMVPLNGLTVPHILIFYRDSLILAAFALIMTIVFRKLQMTTATAPKWIFTIVSTLGYYRILRFLVINDEEPKDSFKLEEEIEDNVETVQFSSSESINKEKIWSGFAKLLECISFFSIFLTYFILLVTLIPK